jgi:DHA1 family bicyclomycin/chloramphenicol resistance-like MFS transporter
MTTDSLSQERAATPWGLVILLGALTAMGPVAIDMYLPSLPAMGLALHASPKQTQATVTAFLAGMAIGQVFYGSASDRLGRRGPIIAGALIYVAASICCALATSPLLLIVSRAVQALGACAGAVVARAVVRDRFNHLETARMLSLLSLTMGLAPICAPMIGGALLAVGGWRSNFFVMAGFGLAVGVAAFVWMKESLASETSAQARSESVLSSYLALLRQRRVVGYALAGGLNGAALFTYISTAPDLLIGSYKVPAAQFGWVFGVNAAGLIGAGQINRLLLRWLHPDVILSRASLTAVGVGFLLLLCAVSGFGERWTILPLLFALLSTYGFMQGNTFAGALNVDVRRSGSISALMGAASFGVGAVVSGIVALFHDGTARPMAASMFISMVGSALALRLLALPRQSEAVLATAS